MSKRFALLILVMAATLAVSLGYASQSNANVTLPAPRTTPTSGKQMYTNYCAPCHGVDGRGTGPVSIALKIPPADLTVLSKNNHGKFPDSHIAGVLQNGVEISGHGSVEMPVWGPIFGDMDTTSPQNRMIRISNLTRYLETLQAK